MKTLTILEAAFKKGCLRGTIYYQIGLGTFDMREGRIIDNDKFQAWQPNLKGTSTFNRLSALDTGTAVNFALAVIKDYFQQQAVMIAELQAASDPIAGHKKNLCLELARAINSNKSLKEYFTIKLEETKK
jgi:hypothetical protein